MTVAELAKALEFELLNAGDGDRKVTGGYCGDLLSWVMGRAKPGDTWITIMSNVNVAAVAALADVACVILAEGVEPDDALKAKFAIMDAAVYRSALGAFELAGKINGLL